MIEYTLRTATVSDIIIHLNRCRDNVIPVLEKITNIEVYSKKLAEYSVTFEAWYNKDLIGLVAAYFNDPKNKLGFITNVSVIKEYYRKGIASKLLNDCIVYGQQNYFQEIRLDVSVSNEQAISLYRKFNFEEVLNDGVKISMNKYL